MSIQEDSENLCSIKRKDFNKIFYNFFTTEDITEKI